MAIRPVLFAVEALDKNSVGCVLPIPIVMPATVAVKGLEELLPEPITMLEF